MALALLLVLLVALECWLLRTVILQTRRLEARLDELPRLAEGRRAARRVSGAPRERPLMRRSPHGGEHPPLASVILTTRGRPRFLEVALRCYQHQTYAPRELIVVDDGDHFPADEQAIAAVGGRLIRAEPGTPLGTKLNLGAQAASGTVCQKMDDDDWYAPAYLETMIAAWRKGGRTASGTPLAFLTPFLFFDVARWEVRRSVRNNVAGATLLFGRADWQARPFRALPGDEDVWFFLDQTRRGKIPLPVRASELFLAVRHRGTQTERGHTWVTQSSGVVLEDELLERELHPGGPESLLPDWALAFYTDLRRELLATPRDTS